MPKRSYSMMQPSLANSNSLVPSCRVLSRWDITVRSILAPAASKMEMISNGDLSSRPGWMIRGAPGGISQKLVARLLSFFLSALLSFTSHLSLSERWPLLVELSFPHPSEDRSILSHLWPHNGHHRCHQYQPRSLSPSPQTSRNKTIWCHRVLRCGSHKQIFIYSIDHTFYLIEDRKEINFREGGRKGSVYVWSILSPPRECWAISHLLTEMNRCNSQFPWRCWRHFPGKSVAVPQACIEFPLWSHHIWCQLQLFHITYGAASSFMEQLQLWNSVRDRVKYKVILQCISGVCVYEREGDWNWHWYTEQSPQRVCILCHWIYAYGKCLIFPRWQRSKSSFSVSHDPYSGGVIYFNELIMTCSWVSVWPRELGSTGPRTAGSIAWTRSIVIFCIQPLSRFSNY